MIEGITILTKGGLVLWNYSFYPLRGNPVNQLIKNVFLEERVSEKSFSHDNYTLEWTFANDFDLIFVVIYQKLIQVYFVSELLDIVKDMFCEKFKGELEKRDYKGDFGFQDEFMNILRACEEREKKQQLEKKQKGFQKKIKEPKETLPEPVLKMEKEIKETPISPKSSGSLTTKATNSIEENRRLMRQKFAMRGAKKPSKKETPYVPPKRETKKVKRTWNEHGDVDVAELDKSPEDQQSLDANIDSFAEKFMQGSQKIDLEFDEKQFQKKKKTKSVFYSFLSNFGGRVLDEKNLEPVMEQFKNELQAKNVAGEIAAKICESVKKSLIGKSTGTFKTISSTVKTAMAETLTRILTPKRHIDVLREVMNARDQGRPYSIVMVGVNGVGKSTSLAKICFWLKQNGLKVMIAACDTFRSGSVEQLNVHAKCLNIDLYQRGYGKDPALVAKEALQYAKSKKYDVVMIDTAGRMQDNEPLMRSLHKLISINNPDLVLFVGEALVGNDGVDQLIKFDKALTQIASQDKQTKPRSIDGIVLTKFDTIDDKVGAAISMVYSTGHPIVFVGVGQTYTDLKNLSVKAIVNALFK